MLSHISLPTKSLFLTSYLVPYRACWMQILFPHCRPSPCPLHDPSALLLVRSAPGNPCSWSTARCPFPVNRISWNLSIPTASHNLRRLCAWFGQTIKNVFLDRGLAIRIAMPGRPHPRPYEHGEMRRILIFKTPSKRPSHPQPTHPSLSSAPGYVPNCFHIVQLRMQIIH